MPRLIDLSNKKFDRLTVISREGIDSRKKPTWLCLCKCGEQWSADSRRGGLSAAKTNVQSGQIQALGRIWGKKSVESGRLLAVASAGGSVGGRIAVETGQLASVRTRETCAKGGRSNVESGHMARIQILGARARGKANVDSGHIQRLGRQNVTNGVLEKGRHIRWHTNRDIINSDCRFCKEAAQ
jgi:hypothetical protein